MRKRAERLAPSQNTHRPSNLPEIGKKRADNAHRDGGAERCPAPAVPKRREGNLPLIDHDDPWRRDVALSVLKTAKQHEAHTCYRLRTVPGIGASLRLVLRYEIPDIQPFPRGQDCVSACRLGQCAQASAGQRCGPSGPKIGQASLQWAFSAAAVVFRRNNPHGQKSLARVEKKHGQGQAGTLLAHQLARAVYVM